MRATLIVLATCVFAGVGLAQGWYLWGELTLPSGAVEALPAKAQKLGLPLAQATAEGLKFVGTSDEATLLQKGSFLFLDGPFFLLGVDLPGEKAFLRGGPTQAELIVWPSDTPGTLLLDWALKLGLLPQGCAVGLVVKEIPLKLPRAPEGVRLDSVLWALVVHPDWIGFARDYGIERQGLRVRVVAEVRGPLGAQFEPYVASSGAQLVELAIPIPLLPELGRAPQVKLVRLPYVPHP